VSAELRDVEEVAIRHLSITHARRAFSIKLERAKLLKRDVGTVPSVNSRSIAVPTGLSAGERTVKRA
jgi:hypothetical protein